MSFKDNLRRYREQAGLSVADMSKALGIPYNTFQNYESKGTEARYDILCKIAGLLHVSVDALLGYEPDSKAGMDCDISQLLNGSTISIIAVKDDMISLSFNGKIWGIPREELYLIYERAAAKARDNDQREFFCKFIYEYFLLHDPV